MESIFAPIKSAWRVVDIRKKLIATFLLLLVYRFGVYVPILAWTEVFLPVWLANKAAFWIYEYTGSICF